MTGSRLLQPVVVYVLAALLASSPGHAQPDAGAAARVTLTPAVVLAGSPELIRVDAPEATAVEGAWLGQRLEFFRGREGRDWFALAGVDVEGATGLSTLAVTAHEPGGARVVSLGVDIRPAHYRTTRLTVAPRFTTPSAAQLRRIEAEKQLKNKIFSSSADRPLWRGNFRAPVRSAPTDSFGSRRLFNGEIASVHKGMDFHARTGTPVRADNSGVVVLARHLYFEGNIVVIDHGLGLFTMDMHLSRIRVREGEHVKTGQLLGLSGATGRVTGPHLHWAVRWQGAYLDPAILLRMNLSAAR